MATFRVGQRVRIVNAAPDSAYVIGDEVQILALPGWSTLRPTNYRISVPPSALPHERWMRWGAPAEYLAPLTDPKADEFIERIKKLGREPVGLPQKETVEARK